MMDPEAFAEAVADAIDLIPDELFELLDNVIVQIEEEPTRQQLLELGIDPENETLFGLYSGTPLSARGDGYMELPDVIQIYRLPLLGACATREELIREIQLTVLHEIGHHFGLDEEAMASWEQTFEAMPVPPKKLRTIQ